MTAPDPIECGHEAELGQLREQVAAHRAEIRAQGDALIRARIQLIGRGVENARLRAELDRTRAELAAVDAFTNDLDTWHSPHGITAQTVAAELRNVRARAAAVSAPIAAHTTPYPLPPEPGNAEDCPHCRERHDLPYPFLCPGHPQSAAPTD